MASFTTTTKTKRKKKKNKKPYHERSCLELEQKYFKFVKKQWPNSEGTFCSHWRKYCGSGSPAHIHNQTLATILSPENNHLFEDNNKARNSQLKCCKKRFQRFRDEKFGKYKKTEAAPAVLDSLGMRMRSTSTVSTTAWDATMETFINETASPDDQQVLREYAKRLKFYEAAFLKYHNIDTNVAPHKWTSELKKVAGAKPYAVKHEKLLESVKRVVLSKKKGSEQRKSSYMEVMREYDDVLEKAKVDAQFADAFMTDFFENGDD